MDIDQKKAELREQLLNRREAIPQKEYQRTSSAIVRRLQELPEYVEAETIHCYVSMNSRREVDTRGLIKEMLSQDKSVAVPVTNFDDGTLTHIHLTSFELLEKNKWGVLEPASGDQFAAEEMELVIVPMVGGDRQGNRLGYGKGFYDRFLSNVSCPKIGLLFERNVVEEIPVDKHDIPLDKIITEQGIIHSK